MSPHTVRPTPLPAPRSDGTIPLLDLCNRPVDQYASMSAARCVRNLSLPPPRTLAALVLLSASSSFHHHSIISLTNQ